MRELFRQVLQLFFLMLVLIIPFLLFHERITAWWQHWQQAPPPLPIAVSVVIGLLSSDIVLPVPSSLVCTFAGIHMGGLLGTLACWTGMNIGCIVAFALARRYGSKFVERLSKPAELEQVRSLSDRYGPTILVLMRGAPVFAEASVLFVGLHKLTWRRFLLPVVGTNFILSLFYCYFGEIAADHDLVSVAIGAAIAVPVLLIAIVRYSLPKQ
ncbi:MAG: putative membrane protein YdjX (TVP38/TMEM64 family) [Pirellulaceae bacterium]